MGRERQDTGWAVHLCPKGSRLTRTRCRTCPGPNQASGCRWCHPQMSVITCSPGRGPRKHSPCSSIQRTDLTRALQHVMSIVAPTLTANLCLEPAVVAPLLDLGERRRRPLRLHQNSVRAPSACLPQPADLPAMSRCRRFENGCLPSAPPEQAASATGWCAWQHLHRCDARIAMWPAVAVQGELRVLPRWPQHPRADKICASALRSFQKRVDLV